jgi:hypothetical protein
LKHVPRFDEESEWRNFKETIEMMFTSIGVSSYLYHPPSPNSRIELRNDEIVRVQILTRISPKFRELVKSCHTTHEAWRILVNHFDENPATKLKALTYEWHTIRKQPNQSTKEYLDAVKEIHTSLSSYGIKLGDMMFVQKILTTIPSSYQGLINAANAASLQKISELFSYLCPTSQDPIVKPKQTQDLKALSTEAKKGKGGKPKKKCGYCQKGWHAEKNCWSKNPHLRPQKKQSQTNTVKMNPKPETNSIQAEEEVHDFKGFATTTKESERQDLMLDSGANVCVTNRKDLLWNYRPTQRQVSVESSCGSQSDVQGEGELHLAHGRVILPDVLFVPNVQNTLIATSSLRDQGLHILMRDKTIITNAARTIQIDTLERNGLTFIPISSVSTIQANSTITLESAHSRFGHASGERLLPLISISVIQYG